MHTFHACYASPSIVCNSFTFKSVAVARVTAGQEIRCAGCCEFRHLDSDPHSRGVCWYYGVAFAFMFSYCTGMPDYPAFQETHRWRRQGPRVEHSAWDHIMARRAEGQMVRDWQMGFCIVELPLQNSSESQSHAMVLRHCQAGRPRCKDNGT